MRHLRKLLSRSSFCVVQLGVSQYTNVAESGDSDYTNVVHLDRSDYTEVLLFYASAFWVKCLDLHNSGEGPAREIHAELGDLSVATHMAVNRPPSGSAELRTLRPRTSMQSLGYHPRL